MTQRNRSSASPTSLAERLIQVADSRNFVKYASEDSSVMNSKLDIAGMKSSQQVLKALWEVDPSLSFKRTTIRSALDQVRVQKWKTWGLKEKHWPDWLTTLENRIMNMLRHANQALRTQF